MYASGREKCCVNAIALAMGCETAFLARLLERAGRRFVGELGLVGNLLAECLLKLWVASSSFSIKGGARSVYT